MYRNFFILFILTTPTLLSAQVGDIFPELSAETANNEVVTLPAENAEKFTLVGMAYSKKSENDLQSWFVPVFNKFINPSDGGLFAAFAYDVNVYFIPMFTGAWNRECDK